jgi:hypothetical protein
LLGLLFSLAIIPENDSFNKPALHHGESLLRKDLQGKGCSLPLWGGVLADEDAPRDREMGMAEKEKVFDAVKEKAYNLFFHQD